MLRPAKKAARAVEARRGYLVEIWRSARHHWWHVFPTKGEAIDEGHCAEDGDTVRITRVIVREVAPAKKRRGRK